MEFSKILTFENGWGLLSRNRNFFPNSKMLSLDSVLLSCKNLLLSRQVVLVKKSCLIVAENVKCRDSWFKIKESRRFFSNTLVFRVWATDSAFATMGKQPQFFFALEHDLLLILNQEFRHFTFSATIKQDFFTLNRSISRDRDSYLG